MNQPQTIIVVSHTHWDREWYRTFQQFRFALVDTMDRLLDLLDERPDYRHILLDGQSILLEDYLAMRPERAADVRRHAHEGRLGIGPWYVQPDEFLASGEALIRNLLLGHRVSASLGPPLKVGWLPDTFGHVSQLPQILCQFEIDTFVSSRGLGDHLERPTLEFWWAAPDGTRVLALNQHEGYWNAGNLGYPYFWGETCHCEADMTLARAQIRELMANLGPLAASCTIAIWNGADHQPPQASLPDVIACLNDEMKGVEIQHGRVEDYAQAVREADPDLPLVQGELRGSRYQNIHASVLSSRIHLKQANHRVQRLLEQYAEPLASVAWMAGDSYPAARLREAWRLLLQNHPHDSICGCSIDQVHREMGLRFEQAQQIADCTVERAFHTLASKVDTSWCSPSAIPIVIFNPVEQERHDVVDVTLRLPQRRACRVVDAAGKPVRSRVLSQSVEPYAWMNRTTPAGELAPQLPFLRQCLRALDGLDVAAFHWETDWGEHDPPALHLRLADWPCGSDQVVERLRAEAQELPPEVEITINATYVELELAMMADLPACGYATYAVELTAEPIASGLEPQAGHPMLENKHLRIEVSPRGRLTLVDRRSGRVLQDLLQIEDMADHGDCYDFCPLPGDHGQDLIEEEAEIELLHANDLLNSLAIHHRLRIPRSLEEDGKGRSSETVELPATTILKLKAGSPYLEVFTRVENRARDHRLRVRFPTGVESDVVHADGHFSIATRGVAPKSSDDWHQPPSEAQPHHTWFGADDGRAGLAVLSEGLPEHAGVSEPEGLTLTLTLLRSVDWLSRGDLSTRQGHSGPARATPAARCVGAYAFRYGLLPYASGPVEGGVPFQARRFDVPPIVHLAEASAGTLPTRQSVVSLQPDELILTALKRSEEHDGLLLRFYSVADSLVQATVRFGFRVTEAHRATAAERIVEPLALTEEGYACTLDVGPAEIVTLLVRFATPLEPGGLSKPSADG